MFEVELGGTTGPKSSTLLNINADGVHVDIRHDNVPIMLHEFHQADMQTESASTIRYEPRFFPLTFDPMHQYLLLVL